MLLMLFRRYFLMLGVFFFAFGIPVGIAQDTLKLVNHALASYSGETLLKKGLRLKSSPQHSIDLDIKLNCK